MRAVLNVVGRPELTGGDVVPLVEQGVEGFKNQRLVGFFDSVRLVILHLRYAGEELPVRVFPLGARRGRFSGVPVFGNFSVMSSGQIVIRRGATAAAPLC